MLRCRTAAARRSALERLYAHKAPAHCPLCGMSGMTLAEVKTVREMSECIRSCACVRAAPPSQSLQKTVVALLRR